MVILDLFPPQKAHSYQIVRKREYCDGLSGTCMTPHKNVLFIYQVIKLELIL